MAGSVASNSFLMPAYQVNAMIKTPGCYKNRDYVKAGFGMTFVFPAITVSLVCMLFCQKNTALLKYDIIPRGI
ncbi:MAG: hypothetical protein PHV39_01145 [Methanomicrobium sp.]|nr:hypothetical protein [Methanomicrobium sp.]